jgi:putative endonuclease
MREVASSQAQDSAWQVYIVRCRDNTLYTGITTNLERRVAEHNSGDKSAKYTRARQPVTLVYSENHENRSAATKREREIKSLTAKQKRALIDSENPKILH